MGILTPAVYYAEAEASTIYMEKLAASMVKDLLLPEALSQEGWRWLKLWLCVDDRVLKSHSAMPGKYRSQKWW